MAIDGEHLDDLITGLVALKLLAIEQFLLQLFNRLASLDEGLRDATIATAVAGGDQISHAARLKESGHQEAFSEEGLAEANHLLQTNANDGSLGVVAQTKTVSETSSTGNNVLRKLRFC